MAGLELYGLVNNAGYGVTGAVEDVGDEEARALFETMVHAPMRLARLALPSMRAHRARSHRQHLVDRRPRDHAVRRALHRREARTRGALRCAARRGRRRRHPRGAGRAGRVQDRHLGGARTRHRRPGGGGHSPRPCVPALACRGSGSWSRSWATPRPALASSRQRSLPAYHEAATWSDSTRRRSCSRERLTPTFVKDRVMRMGLGL